MKEKEYTKEQIACLLERFMDGETTLEEERLLGEYFQAHQDIPAEWKEYQQMFSWFDQGMPLEPARRHVGKWPWVAAAAAAVLVAAMVMVFAFPRSDKAEVAQTVVSQQEPPKVRVQPEPPVDVPAVKVALPATHPQKSAAKTIAKNKQPRKPKALATEKSAEEPQLASNLDAEVVRQLLEDDARSEALLREQIRQMVLFDALLQSEGYLRVMLADGRIAYTQQPIYVME